MNYFIKDGLLFDIFCWIKYYKGEVYIFLDMVDRIRLMILSGCVFGSF